MHRAQVMALVKLGLVKKCASLHGQISVSPVVEGVGKNSMVAIAPETA